MKNLQKCPNLTYLLVNEQNALIVHDIPPPQKKNARILHDICPAKYFPDFEGKRGDTCPLLTCLLRLCHLEFQSRGHSISDMLFPNCGPLKQILQRFSIFCIYGYVNVHVTTWYFVFQFLYLKICQTYGASTRLLRREERYAACEDLFQQFPKLRPKANILRSWP